MGGPIVEPLFDCTAYKITMPDGQIHEVSYGAWLEMLKTGKLIAMGDK